MNEFSSQEFIQDFLQEAEEHLQQVHHNLLRVEQEGELTGTPGEISDRMLVVEELFRSFHTLKSLCAMVGLETAARLSHALETVLDSIRKGQADLTPPLAGTLLQASQTLEVLVRTVLDSEAEEPAIQPDLDALEQALQGPAQSRVLAESAALEPQALFAGQPQAAAGLKEGDWLRVRAAMEKSQLLYLAVFTPTVERASQGLTVSSVREKLLRAGDLLKALPLIEGTQVRFGFIIAADRMLPSSDYPEVELHPLAGPQLALATPPSESVPSQAPRSVSTPVNVVRINLDRLDDLMTLASELVITHEQIAGLQPALQGAAPDARRELALVLNRMDRDLHKLRRSILRARMVPLSEAFGPMALAIRDLARSTGKEIHLAMEGQEIEIDKALVERLLDPLLHLVRNAVIHGIEPPADREAAGKPRAGTVSLRAERSGENILITVADDGRGILLEQVARQAAGLGWLPAGSTLSEPEALAILCRPGFSTQAHSDLGAGRGIGMDVVRRAAQAAGGSLSMHTQTGQGASFILRLPLTLAMTRVIFIQAGPERFAIPHDRIDEVLEINPRQVVRVEGGELYPHHGASLALLHLARLFNLSNNPAAPASRYGLVMHSNSRSTLLGVDRLLGMREVVIHILRDPYLARPGIFGATELGDGSLVLILDPEELVNG